MQWLALERNRPTFESGFDQASQFSTEDDALVLLTNECVGDDDVGSRVTS